MEDRKINKLRRMKDIQITHIMRKGNQVTNYFANNLFFYFEGTNDYEYFQDLPAGAKTLLDINKQRVPTQISQSQ